MYRLRAIGFCKNFAALSVALALLSGWQATLEHPIEHVDAHGRLVHLQGADGGDARGENDSPEGDPSQRLGELLAALAACAAVAAPCLVAAWARHDPVLPWYQGAPRAAEAPPFLSQGPPASV
jgi:hypothetical protein